MVGMIFWSFLLWQWGSRTREKEFGCLRSVEWSGCLWWRAVCSLTSCTSLTQTPQNSDHWRWHLWLSSCHPSRQQLYVYMYISVSIYLYLYIYYNPRPSNHGATTLPTELSLLNGLQVYEWKAGKVRDVFTKFFVGKSTFYIIHASLRQYY